LRAGFPHSDICGSMLVCQLPAAFRRLPRPSSPVIAKASTTCTFSLDPITVRPPLRGTHRYRLITTALVLPPPCPNSNKTGRYNQNPAMPPKLQVTWLYFFHIVKEQTALVFKKPEPSKLLIRLVLAFPGGGERDRTDDPLLAKQVLSQLSYTPKEDHGGSGWIRTNDPRLIKTVL
jgi:hypothetical protein